MTEALGAKYSVKINNRRILGELARLIINFEIDKDPQVMAALCKKATLPSIVFKEKEMYSTSPVSGQKRILDGNYNHIKQRIDISKLTLSTLLQNHDDDGTDQIVEKHSQKWLAFILAHELRHWIQFRFSQKRKLKYWLICYGKLLLKYAWIITGIYFLVFALSLTLFTIFSWYSELQNIGMFLLFYIISILFSSLGLLTLAFLVIGRTMQKINGAVDRPWNVWLDTLNRLDHKIQYHSSFEELDANYFAKKAVQSPSWLNLIEIKKLF